MDRGEHWRKNHYTFGTIGRFYSNGRGCFTKEESSESSNYSEAISLSYKSSFSSGDFTEDDLGFVSLLKSTYNSEARLMQNKTNLTLVDNSVLAEFDPYYTPSVGVSKSSSPITCKEIISNVEELRNLTNEEECDIYEQKLRTMKFIMESKKRIKYHF